MAIDSVGGGNSGDPTYPIKRRALDEERNRELERIEKKYRDDVERTQEARQRHLNNIYVNQELEIKDRQGEADDKVERAKQAADARLREFQHESARLTDEAKRQFQSKANQLAKTSQEFSAQRQHMIKQHEDGMKKMRENQEDSAARLEARAQSDSLQRYNQVRKNLADIEGRGALEEADLRNRLADEKSRTTAEGQRTIASQKAFNEEAKASMERELGHFKRASSEQLNSERDRLARDRSHMESDFEREMSEKSADSRVAINRAQMDGRRALNESKEKYHNEIVEAEKSARKNIKDIQQRTAKNQHYIESEAKFQEAIAKKSAGERNAQLQASIDQSLTDHSKRSNELREKLDKDYREQYRMISSQQKQLINEQTQTFKDELDFQRKLGARQVNEASKQNIEKLGRHMSKVGDPFYRVHDLGAEVNENEAEFSIRVNIPPHEQDSIRLSRQSETLTLSGTRRHEEKAALENGQKISTNSYQSYTQVFPYKGRLEMGKMQRSYVDGVLTIRIPKG